MSIVIDQNFWLVPHDHTPEADDAAFVAARELSHSGGGTLVLLHVGSPEIPGAGWSPFGSPMAKPLGHIPPQPSSHLKELGAEIGSSTPSVSVRLEVRTGPPAEKIIEVADELGAGRIVMPSHHYSTFSRWMLGSVAEAVLRRAEIPVLIIKGPKGAAESVSERKPAVVQ